MLKSKIGILTLFLHISSYFKRIKISHLGKVIIIGLVIRFILAPISIGLNDGYYWYILFINILTGENPYIRRDIVYPPSWFYTLVPFAYIYAYFAQILNLKPIPIENLTFPLYVLMLTRWGPSAIIDPLSATLMKIPLFLSDLGTSLVIFHYIKEITGDDKKAFTGASFWFLNPYVIVISSLWGQIDTLGVFFLILATYYLHKKQFFRSGLYSGVSISYKIIMGIFIFSMIFSIIFSHFKPMWRSLLAFITSLTLIFLMLSAPFLILSSNAYVSSVLWPFSYGASSSFASFIYIFLKFVSLNEWVARSITNGSFVILVIAINYLIYKFEGNTIFSFNKRLLYSALAFYALSHASNERYFLLALPYVIVNTISIGKNRKFLHLYWFIPFIYIILTQGLTLFMPLFAIINDYKLGEAILFLQKNYDYFVLHSVLMSQILTVLQTIPSLVCFLLIVKLFMRYLGDDK